MSQVGHGWQIAHPLESGSGFGEPDGDKALGDGKAKFVAFGSIHEQWVIPIVMDAVALPFRIDEGIATT